MELPIKVNGVIYTLVEGKIKVLIVKRCKKDGGFWQTVTGTLDEGETLENCLRREIKEETGIDKIDEIKKDLHRFHWDKKDGTPINEYVYAVKVSLPYEIKISDEHEDSKWADINEAIDMVKMESNKTSIRNLANFVSSV